MGLFVRLSPDYTILIKFVTRRELYNTPHVYHVSCKLGSMAVQYWQLPCAEPEIGFGTFLRNSEHRHIVASDLWALLLSSRRPDNKNMIHIRWL